MFLKFKVLINALLTANISFILYKSSLYFVTLSLVTVLRNNTCSYL